MSQPPTSIQKHKHPGLALSIFVGIVGVILSIVLHELFHVYMHWKTIVHFSVFANPLTLVEIDVNEPGGYDYAAEEIVAYTVTLVTILITVIIITRLHDHYDKKSLSQTLVPKNSSLRSMSKREFMKIVRRLLP